MKPKPQTHAPADRKLRTPKAVQTRVLAASLAGKSNWQISRELGVDRHTVGRILSQQEVRSPLEEYRQQAREGTQKSAKGAKKRMSTNSARQAQVTAAYLAGKSQRQIAREHHMAEKTVRKIVSSEEFHRQLEQYRQDLASRVPKALGVFDEMLENKKKPSSPW